MLLPENECDNQDNQTMKSLWQGAVLMLAVLIAFNASGKKDSAIADSVGYLTPQQILASYPEFKSGYQDYQPSPADIEHIKKLTGKELLVMFGNWCHDSQREIPRLLKLLDSSGVELQKLTLLAVDRTKQEPSGKAKANRLKYTPTIVLLEGDKELGRIVERPRTTLAQDLASMLGNQEY
ncbi:thioredoxin family protein [Planctobacterium marinum]|uniref:thioredoxin family protein n=1 Tax=Planctobacterium marinum TaxID=1631968 RepID=UPI001E62D10A|nr:thioredoxin family protein [Planctobacterium marinum]MCC2604596.1 thioredoxin family protein [Planctobacterium marinum]